MVEKPEGVSGLARELDELRRKAAEREEAVRELERIRAALTVGSQAYLKIIRNVPEIIALLDSEATILNIGPSVKTVAGYAAGEVVGRRAHEFVHRDDLPRLSEILAASLEEPDGIFREEIRFRRAGGSYLYLDFTGMNFLDNPAVRAIVVTARDVTDRKKMEAAIRERESFYRSVIKNIHDVILVINAAGVMDFVSPSIERVFGYHPDRFRSKDIECFLEICHPEDVSRLADFVSASLREKGLSEPFVFRVCDSGGRERVAESRAVNLLDDPAVGGSVHILRDVTDRVREERALQDRERYYRSLIRNAADMVSVLDGNLSFRWGSLPSGLTTGYDPREVYGKPIRDFVHPDDREQSREDIEFVLANPGVPYKCERRFRHRDGTYHWHQAILTNLLEDPSVRGIIINSRDINERVLVEEQLRERNRELNDFASIVSHDLRTPIALIEGYAQLMRAGETTDEERESYLHNIIDAARRTDELIESLLDYAQAGQPKEQVEPSNPEEVLEGVLAQYRDSLEWHNIEVVVQDGLPPVLAERPRLHQVFSNLVDNAIKYMGDKAEPRIEIRAERAMDTVTFLVRDNGQGIDAPLLEEIFSPFKRGSSGTRGLGIGLSAVKRAVEGWGGRIWVESQPGEGTVFFFTVPTA